MATTVPYKIDDGDLEKYLKQVRANNPAVDMVGVNKHDIGMRAGELLTPARRRVDDGDLSTMIRRAALV
jgi:hypothetical protein